MIKTIVSNKPHEKCTMKKERYYDCIKILEEDILADMESSLLISMNIGSIIFHKMKGDVFEHGHMPWCLGLLVVPVSYVHC